MSTSTNAVELIKESIDRGAEIVLVKVDSKKYVKVSLEIIKYFTEIAEGIFVTLNRP